MRYKYDDDKVDYLFSIWEGLIKYSNSGQKTDNNKSSEEVILTLFNLLKNANYEDLNRDGTCGGVGKPNFGGVDIGWLNNDAYQITSETTGKKIKEAIAIFDKNNLIEQFPKGIRFLWLTSDKKNRKRKVKVQGISYFDSEKHIISFTDIANDVKTLKLIDEDRYNSVIQFLVKQFIEDLPALFQLNNQEEKIIREIQTSIETFYNRLNEFDTNEPVLGTKIKGVGLLTRKLGLGSGKNHDYPDTERVIRAIQPILGDFNNGIKKIKQVKSQSAQAELIGSANDHFEQIKKYLNLFADRVKTIPAMNGKERLLSTIESIMEILNPAA